VADKGEATSDMRGTEAPAPSPSPSSLTSRDPSALSARPSPLRAITLDYWDTIYSGVSTTERVQRRHHVLMRMLEVIGAEVPAEEFDRLYRASAAEADRWWRDEHRGYTTADRIRWILAQLAIERPEKCEHIARAVREVDASLVEFPPELLPGAANAIRVLSQHFRLGIISDTGFVSGRAQNEVLALDRLLGCFATTVYSMDVGHAKPRPEPFLAALNSLQVKPGEALHIGDNERTDVGGALAMGIRAIRLDVVRDNGPSAAEHVATSYEDLVRYLTAEAKARS
jgi:HAD superfamily hydrolase (TIGR01549 family)